MKTSQVKAIDTAGIRPNPHNPRRLFDDEPMQILKESISRLGILVPVTVYVPKKDPRSFVLLDGERRWRCAKAIGLHEIPAIIIEEPDETQNILTMFHIHNVREGWQLMPTALKLKQLMKRLGTENERELSELTKLSISQIRRCKILLSYPTHFQNLMLAVPDERLKSDFFIELDRLRRPARSLESSPWENAGDHASIEACMKKYLNGTIRSVTEFRKAAEYLRGAERQNNLQAFSSRLEEFLDKPSANIDHLAIEGADFAKEAKEISRSATRLLGQIQNIDLENVAWDEDMLTTLRQLSALIEEKLRDALLTPYHQGSSDDE